MRNEQQFKDQLRTAGERVTTPRLSVFRVLSRHSPLLMAKLIEQARADGVDPVTTYRTLDLFRRLAVVQEVGLGRNRLLELSDGYQLHHHHFSCVNCGRIYDFDSEELEDDLRSLSARLGFDIQSHQLEATGVCAACRTKNAV